MKNRPVVRDMDGDIIPWKHLEGSFEAIRSAPIGKWGIDSDLQERIAWNPEATFPTRIYTGDHDTFRTVQEYLSASGVRETRCFGRNLFAEISGLDAIALSDLPGVRIHGEREPEYRPIPNQWKAFDEVVLSSSGHFGLPLPR